VLFSRVNVHPWGITNLANVKNDENFKNHLAWVEEITYRLLPPSTAYPGEHFQFRQAIFPKMLKSKKLDR
jgi:hypothetical protein